MKKCTENSNKSLYYKSCTPNVIGSVTCSTIYMLIYTYYLFGYNGVQDDVTCNNSKPFLIAKYACNVLQNIANHIILF